MAYKREKLESFQKDIDEAMAESKKLEKEYLEYKKKQKKFQKLEQKKLRR